MAIAWIYRDDYERAGLQMLPVVDPSGRRAGRCAVVGAVLTLIVGVMPFGWSAPTFYLVAATVFGSIQLLFAMRFALRLDELSARNLMRFSLIYLPAMLACFASAACM